MLFKNIYVKERSTLRYYNREYLFGLTERVNISFIHNITFLIDKKINNSNKNNVGI